MTPLELAENMAKSNSPLMRAEAVAIIARGLSDPDPSDPFRQPWPLNMSIRAAAQYLGLDLTDELRAEATRLAPMLDDFILNR